MAPCPSTHSAPPGFDPVLSVPTQQGDHMSMCRPLGNVHLSLGLRVPTCGRTGLWSAASLGSRRSAFHCQGVGTRLPPPSTLLPLEALRPHPFSIQQPFRSMRPLSPRQSIEGRDHRPSKWSLGHQHCRTWGCDLKRVPGPSPWARSQPVSQGISVQSCFRTTGLEHH